jgi:hypothetical protein
MGYATSLTPLGCGDLARPLPDGYFDPEPWWADWWPEGAVSLVMTVLWLNAAA